MTNGEDEIREDENRVPNQAPPAQSSKKTNPLLIIGGIAAVCCIAIVIFFVVFGTINIGDFTLGDTEPKYRNETVGSFTFKIPESYEKQKEDVGGMVEFKNDTNKFVRIEGASEKYNLYTWSLAVSSVIGGVSGNKVDLNGTPAYRFETEDIMLSGPTDQTVYVYALNLDGKSFVIVLSKGIENPNDFLINMTSS